MPENILENADFSRKRGRPTTKIQAETEVTLRVYYEMNLSAQAASRQPGMPSAKTCEKYFRTWTNNYRKNYCKEISERQKNSKMQMIATYDSLIFKSNVQLNKFTKLILEDQKHQEIANARLRAAGKPEKPYAPNPYYEGMFKSLIGDIASLCDAKTALEMQPTFDEVEERRNLNRQLRKLRRK